MKSWVCDDKHICTWFKSVAHSSRISVVPLKHVVIGFQIVVLEKTLESPLDCRCPIRWWAFNSRRSNQSILKEINPEYLLEGLLLKLKLQSFGHLMWRADSLEKTLLLGKIEGKRRRGDREWDGWMASLTQWTWVWANSGKWWWTGKTVMLQPMGLQRVGHNWATEQQQLAFQEFDLEEHWFVHSITISCGPTMCQVLYLAWAITGSLLPLQLIVWWENQDKRWIIHEIITNCIEGVKWNCREVTLDKG